MARPHLEPLQQIKERRDGALEALVSRVPYIQFMGISFDRRGDELTGVMHFDDKLIGNPILPALHGGATAAFLEVTSVIMLSWTYLWDDVESGAIASEDLKAGKLPGLPKTIDFTVDYLRSGLPRDSYARAVVSRSGRRYASVRAEAWQDNRARPFAQASGHFLMPQRDESKA